MFLLGKLVQHAEHHSESHGDDFFTFIQKHYGSLKAEHLANEKEENHDHDQLPFQHISCHHATADVVWMPVEFSLLKPEISQSGSHNFHYQNLYASLEKVSIFQPPKSA